LFDCYYYWEGVFFLNLKGNYFEFNRSYSPQETDYRAKKSDWLAVGKDLEYEIENDK
jgi:hypothetical protein